MSSVISRLSKILDVREEEINKSISNVDIIHFLLVWSNFETLIFDKYCRQSSIFDLNNSSFNDSLQDDLGLYELYFIDRYKKDPIKFVTLGPENRNHSQVRNYIYKSNSCEKCTRLHFLVYIVFRYRNNIFHGNKGSLEWFLYEEPIQKCTEIMLLLLENMKKE